MSKLITDSEIAVHSFESASAIAKELIDNGYNVLISTEEELFILNYIWSPIGSDRNDVVFISREEFDDKYVEYGDEDDPDVASLRNDDAWLDGFNSAKGISGHAERITIKYADGHEVVSSIHEPDFERPAEIIKEIDQ